MTTAAVTASPHSSTQPRPAARLTPAIRTRRLRILHAPAIVTHQQWTLSRAQRTLGHVSDVMAFSAQAGYPTTRCDIDLGFTRETLSLRPRRLWPTVLAVVRFLRFFLKALCTYQVFHFHSESFLGSHGSWDLRLLRLLRKTVVFQYWGFDIKLQTPALLDEPYGAIRSDRRFYANSRKLRDNLTHLQYADFRIYGGADLIRNVPDALFIPVAIDLTAWRPVPVEEIPPSHRLAATTAIRVLHPFQTWQTRGDWKGSRYLRDAVETLQREGAHLEWLLVDQVPNEAMKYYYQQADIVFDQLLSGWHGNVSVEAMAMGKPVLCYLAPEASRLLPPGNPIVQVTVETLTDRLRELVEDPARRADVGGQGRRYVEEHHDSLKIAQRLIDLYQQRWR